MPTTNAIHPTNTREVLQPCNFAVFFTALRTFFNLSMILTFFLRFSSNLVRWLISSDPAPRIMRPALNASFFT